MFLAAGDVTGSEPEHVPILSATRKLPFPGPAESSFDRGGADPVTAQPPPIFFPKHEAAAKLFTATVDADVQDDDERVDTRTGAGHEHQAGASRRHVGRYGHDARTGQLVLLSAIESVVDIEQF